MGIVGQAFGQKASIKGQVNTIKNEPIIGANVILKGTVRGVQTNAKGEYLLKGLSSCLYLFIHIILIYIYNIFVLSVCNCMLPLSNFLR